MALIASLIFLLALLGCLASGVFLLVRTRRPADSHPRCGHCGYNLTGAVSNRCSECGRLFIEAGVIVLPKRRSSATLVVGLVLVILPLVFAFGAIAAGLMAAQAARARAQAIAAQQRAIAAQAQAQVTQQALVAAQQAAQPSKVSAAPAAGPRAIPATKPADESDVAPEDPDSLAPEP